MRLRSWTSSTLIPSWKARATASMRRDEGLLSSARRSSNSKACGSRPVTPMSIMRRAFWSTSGKVFPIAITSPTDFISLPIRVSTSRNFCRSHRGNLHTM